MKAYSLWWAIVFLAGMVLSAPAATLYVSLASSNPVPPYADWSTAATNIQDAIDASTNGDLILVANGSYKFGGRAVYGSETNRVVMTNAITLSSVNGPTNTFILGGTLTRCAYIGSNSILNGFTLTNGQAPSASGPLINVGSGGGAWCETGGVISNCLVAGNSALAFGAGVFGGTVCDSIISSNTLTYNPGGGGGACSNILVNSILTKNNASVGCIFGGGGALGSVLTNCQIVGNQSTRGGGAASCTLVGCSVSNNIAIGSGDGDGGGGVYMGFAVNSLISSNFAVANGGGVCSATLGSCILFSNVADSFGGTGSGGGAAYNSTLTNCILYGNSTRTRGGGANGGMLFTCTVTNNSALYGGGTYGSDLTSCTVANNNAAEGGGGAYNSLLINCLLTRNSTPSSGGGAYSSILANCTVVSNSANFYGGTLGGTNYNSIIFYNSGLGSPNYVLSAMVYCDTIPAASGLGNITNNPAFVNFAGGDFQLQSNSPCINSGKNDYITTTNDLEDNPRIVGGTVDMGAYEYQTLRSVLSYAWAQQYDLPTDGSVDYGDLDGTGFNVYQDWIAGLNPTNPASMLALSPPTFTNSTGVTIRWQSVSDRTYYLQRATDLTAQAPFSAIQSNIVGQAGTTSYTDTTATNGGPYFYRVGAQ